MMEKYTVPGQEYADAYMFQGNGLIGFTGQYAPQDLEHFGTMYKEGASEFLVDQSMYYSPSVNYGYCTGLESPGDWDDRQMVFGADGLDVHYTGVEPENSPFLYYAPNVAYAQSPYNPYNPYIPGAVFGVDGSFVGAPQQHYNLPSFENQSFENQSSSPMHVEFRSDNNAHNNTSHSFVDISSNAYRASGPSLKNNLSSASPAFSVAPWLSAPNQVNSYRRTTGGNNAVAPGSGMRAMAKGNGTPSGLLVHPASTPNIHSRSAQRADIVSHGKALSGRTQSKLGLSSGNGFSNFRPSTHTLNASDKVQPKFTFGKVNNVTKMLPDKSGEQNQSPKINISGNKLTVQAFTSKAGDVDIHGNITINLDQYDKNDIFIDYSIAKFFIIKSYSEDDVHKSIKYNVWSSTPNGNKKLNNAYDGVHRTNALSGSCPIFLFFSVNASGQFCGVAEMTSPIDFHKDMDFWQQDKWSGSFPVKWHIVKDVPNFNFRHIVLVNNDNKPVTNSRDTQEVPYNKGMEMLKIFKSYLSKTSLLDDFLYYENRQRILQEEKTRLILKNYNNPFIVPIQQDPPRKQNPVLEKLKNSSSSSRLDKTLAADDDASVAKNVELEANVEDETLKIGSLTIVSSGHSGSTGPLQEEDATTGGSVVVSDLVSNDVLTVVGSIPVKVNGFAETPSGFLTVGTIQLYPRAIQDMADGGSVKRVARKG